MFSFIFLKSCSCWSIHACQSIYASEHFYCWLVIVQFPVGLFRFYFVFMSPVCLLTMWIFNDISVVVDPARYLSKPPKKVDIYRTILAISIWSFWVFFRLWKVRVVVSTLIGPDAGLAAIKKKLAFILLLWRFQFDQVLVFFYWEKYDSSPAFRTDQMFAWVAKKVDFYRTCIF